jgi:hypothetical protein
MALTERGICGCSVSGIDHTTSASYLGVVTEDPIIAPSALKHGLDETEILHAYRNWSESGTPATDSP